jgi:RNA polymerase sigma-70 factor, ECF subfamily
VESQLSKPITEPRHSASADQDLPLLDRILAGEARAFEELVHRHGQRVYRVAVGITGNHEDAEEAMQQTFLRVHQHLAGFQRSAKFTTWLTRIAVNEALQIRRRRRPTVSLDDLDVSAEALMPKQLRDWHDDPGKVYDKQQLREVVEGAIQSLPTIYREAFVLRDVQGLTSEESAVALGVSVSTLKTRLFRARLLMREALACYFQKDSTLKSRIAKVRWKIQDAFLAGLRRAAQGKEVGSK